MDQLDRGLRQHANEHEARRRTNGPSGAPPRDPRMSIAAAAVLGFVLVLVLLVLAGDCAGDAGTPDSTSPPATTVQADLAIWR